VSALALAICYWDVMYMLANQWWSNSMYTHGFLIPIIAGYVCWATRGKLPAACQPSMTLGVPVLLGGLLLLTIGRAGSLGALQELSLLPVMFGIALLSRRPPLVRALALPILYLLLMIPVWEIFTNRLTGRSSCFQQVSAARCCALSGYRFIARAYSSIFPTRRSKWRQVCSGVNYLVAIAAVGIPLAYLSRSTVARRTALVLFGVIVACDSQWRTSRAHRLYRVSRICDRRSARTRTCLPWNVRRSRRVRRTVPRRTAHRRDVIGWSGDGRTRE
jgi:exosortase